MKITILGSGTCVPSLKRNAQATHLQIGDQSILVDCGSGTLHQLLRENIDYKELDIVCISHYHADHLVELIPIIQALNWTPGFDRKKDLILLGPPGFSEFFSKQILPLSTKPRPNTYDIQVKEIKGVQNFGSFNIESYKTNHCEESIAFKIVSSEKSVVISGDTDYDVELANFAKETDLLVLECSCTNAHKMEGHLCSKEAGLIAKGANAKRLILNHIYPMDPDTRLQEVKEVFPNAEFAEDSMRIDL